MTGTMRIEFKFGCDTPFGLVDVFLQSPEEEHLSEQEVWGFVYAESWSRHKVHGIDIVDFTLYAHDGARMHFDEKSGQMKPSNWEWLPEGQKRST